MHGERGQVLPLMAIGLLAVLLGLAGLAIDVGSWYQAKRHVQAVADASALAAAQALPGDGVTAKSYATSYAATNGGSIDTPQFAPATSPTKDTVTVTATQSAPSFHESTWNAPKPTTSKLPLPPLPSNVE